MGSCSEPKDEHREALLQTDPRAKAPATRQVVVCGVPSQRPSLTVDVVSGCSFGLQIQNELERRCGLTASSYYITVSSRCLDCMSYSIPTASVRVNLRMLGGIDFQNREGSKIGSGGQLSDAQSALGRKERLRKLALETIDLRKDPYFMRNHLGSYECKLCLTLHPNEGNYLAHTQGKRHQSNLGRRAAMEAKSTTTTSSSSSSSSLLYEVKKRKTMKIGRPGYKVTKSRDAQTQQRTLTFEIDFPEVEENSQPRHRFMSAFEQKVEVPDKNVQYLLFACEPYETVAFKIPNQQIDKRQGMFFSNWDPVSKKFVLSVSFLLEPSST